MNLGSTLIKGFLNVTGKIRANKIQTDLIEANIATTSVAGLLSPTDKQKIDGALSSASVATTSANGLMSSTDKTKLDGIATGANNYTHPVTHAPSIIAQDANNRFVTDAKISAWDAKASTAAVTTSANGLMIASDKSKLDGVAAGANNYSHPASHPASMITGLPTSLPANGGNSDTIDGIHIVISTTDPGTPVANTLYIKIEA
jgi:hypothetical protein